MATWRRYLRFWGPNIQGDIDDELRFHVEARVAEYVAAGHGPDDARRLANQRFGDEPGVRSDLWRHDMRKLQQQQRAETVDELMQDIRYGARKLLQAPGFTVAVVSVLALGIGANTAIYSAVDAAFFRPLPFANPDRLVALPRLETPILWPGPPHPKSYPDGGDLAKLDVFESLAMHALGGLNLEGGSEPQRVSAAHVSLDFFKTLGRFPAAGRVFTPEEQTIGGPHAALLSDRTWRAQFGGDANVVGRTITLNKMPYRVVGIMPASFAFPADADIWVPLPMPSDMSIMEGFKSTINSRGIARLAPGVTARQAGERVMALRRQLSERTVVNDSTIAAAVMPIQRSLVPAERRTALFLLMASAALVLLIACANVVNLLLSRAVSRRREMAIRAVLGASRSRIMRQLIVESLLLAVAGAVAGLVVAWFSLAALRGLMPVELTAVAPPQLDTRVLLFALAVAMSTGIVFGLWPAFGATRDNPGETIKSGGAHGSTQRDGNAVRSGLVVVEVALAIILLIGSGLMLQSFRALMSTDAGLQTAQVTTARTTLPIAKYQRVPEMAAFFTTVVDRLGTMSGVQSAAFVNVLPLAQQSTIGLIVRSAEGGTLTKPLHPTYLQVTPGYFATMGITLLRGRDVSWRDDSSVKATVINKAFADQVWPGQDPLGRRFSFGPSGRLVVGVVANVRMLRLEDKPDPAMYFPITEITNNDVNIVARGSLSPDVMSQRIRDAVRAVDPTQAVYSARSMDDVVALSVAPRRTNTVLLVVFGLIAATLAAIGVYGVLAYGVAQRTREIGVRVALGAQRTDVMRLVVGRGVIMTLLGVAIGVGAAYALARLIGSLLYEVSVHDPRIFVAAPLSLFIVSLLATIVPAWRATRVDPIVALREE